MIKKIILFSILFLVFNVNVEAATIEQNFDNIITRLDDYKENAFLNSHPIGSIYITTSIEENTITKMNSKYGGTWEVYGDGRVLKGTTGTSGTTGGVSTVTLTTSTMPLHTHSVPSLKVIAEKAGDHTHTLTAKGTVTSTFTGSSVNTGGASKTLTGSFTNHNAQNYTAIHGVSGIFSSGYTNSNAYFTPANSKQSTGAPSLGTVNVELTHTHSITPSGTVTSTFTGSSATLVSTGVHTHTASTTEATSGTTGSSSPSSFSVLDPYITVYMYKRVS